MSVTIHYQNKVLEIPFENLPKNSNAGYLFGLSQIMPRPLCTGMGKCGRCKVKYHSNIPELSPLEQLLLSREEQEDNIRLACKHPLQDNTVLTIFDDSQQNATRYDLHIAKNNQEKKAIVFIDLGTTSIAFEVRSDNAVLAEGKVLNPQMFAGSDVMARLHYEYFIEKEKPSRLQTVLLEFFQKLCQELAELNILVQKIYLAANPAMLALFLGESTKGLLEAPYHLENKGNKTYQFPKLPPLYIPPQISAFVGADACAGLAYILQNYPNSDNFLLADLGTNGEFIHYSRGKIHAASIPLGPALEGVGMRCGSAVHGEGENIILSFSLTPFGLSYSCKEEAKFICGAAYLCLLNILLSANCVNRQGLFQDSQDFLSPLGKKIFKNLKETNGEKRLYITDKLYLCAEDIENILKVKAAFSSAIELFLEKNNIENIFLSGSLSSHIPLEIMENLGFLPRNSKTKTRILGNSSLKGLTACHTKPELIDTVEKLSGTAEVIDLTNQKEYDALYIDNMHF